MALRRLADLGDVLGGGFTITPPRQSGEWSSGSGCRGRNAPAPRSPCDGRPLGSARLSAGLDGCSAERRQEGAASGSSTLHSPPEAPQTGAGSERSPGSLEPVPPTLGLETLGRGLLTLEHSRGLCRTRPGGEGRCATALPSGASAEGEGRADRYAGSDVTDRRAESTVSFPAVRTAPYQSRRQHRGHPAGSLSGGLEPARAGQHADLWLLPDPERHFPRGRISTDSGLPGNRQQLPDSGHSPGKLGLEAGSGAAGGARRWGRQEDGHGTSRTRPAGEHAAGLETSLAFGLGRLSAIFLSLTTSLRKCASLAESATPVILWLTRL